MHMRPVSDRLPLVRSHQRQTKAKQQLSPRPLSSRPPLSSSSSSASAASSTVTQLAGKTFVKIFIQGEPNATPEDVFCV